MAGKGGLGKGLEDIFKEMENAPEGGLGKMFGLGEGGGAGGAGEKRMLFKNLLNSTIFQVFLWSVVSEVLINMAGGPLQDLKYKFNSIFHTTRLTPAELATAVNRQFLHEDVAAADALGYGLDEQRFRTMIDLAGEAPSPGELATAARRKIIQWTGTGPDAVTFAQGISEGNLRNKWADVIKALAEIWPTPTDALDALLEGQIKEDEARELYQKFGGAPQYFDMLYHTRGSAPTPEEAATMANRGIIPWEGVGKDVTSFEQAFLEGPWRNKWEKAFRAAAEYYPPPRTIVAMLREDALTDEEGAKLLAEQGLRPDLVAAYIKNAHSTKTKHTKELAESVVLKLYLDQFIDKSTTITMLKSLGYTDHDAEFIISVAEIQLYQEQLTNAVSRVRTLYVGHKIDSTTAVNVLNALEIPGENVPKIIHVWTLEREANIKLLTASEIADAYKDDIISQEDAQTKLQELGYQPHDAWLYLSVKLKRKLPNEPPKSEITLTQLGGGK